MFRPSALIAGLVFLAVAAGFGLDAAGAWHAPLVLLPPVVGGGLALAGVAGVISRSAERRRRRAAPADGDPGAGR